MKELILETIKIIPNFIWFGLLFFLILRYDDEIRKLISRISKVKLPGVTIEIIRDELMKTEKIKIGSLPTREEQVSLIKRVEFVKSNLVVLKVLWIDNRPSNNISESRILEEIGLKVTFVPSSEEALNFIQANNFDLIISDITRNDVELEGISFLKTLVEYHHNNIPTIFYTSFDKSDKKNGVPPYAFAITSKPIELIHYCLDIMERNAKCQ